MFRIRDFQRFGRNERPVVDGFGERCVPRRLRRGRKPHRFRFQRRGRPTLQQRKQESRLPEELLQVSHIQQNSQHAVRTAVGQSGTESAESGQSRFSERRHVDFEFESAEHVVRSERDGQERRPFAESHEQGHLVSAAVSDEGQS